MSLTMEDDIINFRINKGNSNPLGASIMKDGINFAVINNGDSVQGIRLVEIQTGKEYKFLFSNEHSIGNVLTMWIGNISAHKYKYCFFNDNGDYIDIYSRFVMGNEIWGPKRPPVLYGYLPENTFDWKSEMPILRPYEQTIIYCLHVRGFTKHVSSKVKHPGTYSGLTEKISYLNNLGVTAVELMPCYEFLEYEYQLPKEALSLQYAVEHCTDLPIDYTQKVNYWGFTSGFYFSPKTSYASSAKEAINEFKTMVKEMHSSGLEVIMQFYFPDMFLPGFILDVVKYWVKEYHIDGVHLKGNKIPITLIATCQELVNTKIMYDYIPEEVYEDSQVPRYKNLCAYSDEFMYKIRRFLKGDEDLCSTAAGLIQQNPIKHAVVNFITNYYGFTLADLVSYDKKHNDRNGEMNRDGADYNYSWNCGVEGSTRKKAILELRKKQVRNALLLVFLSQGTPLLFAGDEFGNSQEGNNNPYCQDNEVTWLNWTMNKSSKDLLDFTTMLINFRVTNKLFIGHRSVESNDISNSGYPVLSYHAEEAWKADFGNYCHHFAIMYANKDTKQNICTLYIAYNMHWQPHEFALPKLPKGKKWIPVLSSANIDLSGVNVIDQITISERSIMVLLSQ